jgi:hypothetical protein
MAYERTVERRPDLVDREADVDPNEESDDDGGNT